MLVDPVGELLEAAEPGARSSPQSPSGLRRTSAFEKVRVVVLDVLAEVCAVLEVEVRAGPLFSTRPGRACRPCSRASFGGDVGAELLVDEHARRARIDAAGKGPAGLGFGGTTTSRNITDASGQTGRLSDNIIVSMLGGAPNEDLGATSSFKDAESAIKLATKSERFFPNCRRLAQVLPSGLRIEQPPVPLSKPSKSQLLAIDHFSEVEPSRGGGNVLPLGSLGSR